MSLYCEKCEREVRKPDRQHLTNNPGIYLFCPNCKTMLSERPKNERKHRVRKKRIVKY